MSPEQGLAALLLFIWGVSEIADLTLEEDDRDDAAAARAAYVNGEIDEVELERRLELAMDPRAEEIRETIETVDGIGPATSASVAMHFEDVGELRSADQEEIEAVHGVGPQTRRAIRDAVGS